MVLNKVAQVTIIFLANGSLQAHRLLADLDNLAYLLRANLHLLGNLFRRGFTPQVLQQATTNTDQAVDRLHHMYRDTNRARLVSDSASDSLANPPGRIRTKLVPFGVVEFLDSTDQADISLLDQVQQAHTAANILFRDTDNQAQICLSQTALSFLAIIDDAAI